MRFQTSADIDTVVSSSWAAFHLGSHQLMFNLGGADVLREIQICSSGATAGDPFSTVQ